MITASEAIVSLRPGTEWSMDGDDIDNITWITPDVIPVTTEEVKTEIKRLEKLAQEKETKNKAARQAAINHAKSLGFTDAMIAVMYPNLSEE